VILAPLAAYLLLRGIKMYELLKAYELMAKISDGFRNLLEIPMDVPSGIELVASSLVSSLSAESGKGLLKQTFYSKLKANKAILISLIGRAEKVADAHAFHDINESLSVVEIDMINRDVFEVNANLPIVDSAESYVNKIVKSLPEFGHMATELLATWSSYYPKFKARLNYLNVVARRYNANDEHLDKIDLFDLQDII
jgi:hypothetical protein